MAGEQPRTVVPSSGTPSESIPHTGMYSVPYHQRIHLTSAARQLPSSQRRA